MYKLQGPGPIIAGRPFEKEELQSLARTYIDAMRAVQPRGPYCLGGMCDGVQIAQQMILELEATGEEVGLFVIFDTWVLENSQVRALWALDYYIRKMKMLRHLPPAERFMMVRKALSRRSQSIARTSHDPSNGRSNGQENGHGWQKAYWPGHDFQEPQFRAPVLLFKRPKQPYIYVRDRQMGWGTRSRGGVEICEVDCRHYEMLRPPYVRYTAARLHARLSEINRRAHSQVVA
jgi:thioesterase domain-containing protein